MNARGPRVLEVLSALPAAPTGRAPLLFVHGAHAGAWCWAEHFLPHFANLGYPAYAVSLSGHAASPGREYLDALSIDDYVADVRETLARLPAPPVLVGHSMGGFVIQKLAEQQPVRAMALVCTVPPHGMFSATLGLAFRRPGLLFELNRFAGGGPISAHAMVQAMFYQPMPPELLERYYLKMQHESQRAVWDMLGFALPRPSPDHCPHVLVMGAEHDALIPRAAVEHTAAVWGVRPHIVADMGHGLMLEPGWRTAAAPLAEWLATLPH